MKYLTVAVSALMLVFASWTVAASTENSIVIYEFKGTVSELKTQYPNSLLHELNSNTLSLADEQNVKVTYARTGKALLSQLRQGVSIPQSEGPDFPEEGDSVTYNWTRTESNGVFEYTQTLTFTDGTWVETFAQREYIGPPPEAESVSVRS